MATQQQIIDLYTQLLGRTPDPTDPGVAYWENQTNGNPTDTQDDAWLRAQIAASPEAAAYTARNTVAPTNNAGVGGLPADNTDPARAALLNSLNNVYRTGYGREADTAGTNYWSNYFSSTPAVESEQQMLDYMRAHSNESVANQTMPTRPADPNATVTANQGQQTVDWALQAARNAVPASPGSLPSWYGDQLRAPVTMDYGTTNPFVQNATPYTAVGGIGQGGYDNLRAQMRGEVDDAYNRALIEGDNRFGGNGLYGSQGTGLQSDYMGQAQKQLQQGYLNADKAGYELQQQDLQNIDAQNQFGWKAGETTAARRQDYGNTKYSTDYAQAQAGNDFYNNNLAGQYNYNLAQQQNTTANNQRQYENYLALATGANPNTAANLSAQTQQSIANANNRTASNNSLMTGVGGVVGGLMSNNKVTSGVSDYFGSLFGNNNAPVYQTNPDVADALTELGWP
jgi:hypothetical protein